MLGDCEIMAMVATARAAEAQSFYGDVLGLTLEEDTPFALVFTGAGRTLRIQKVQSFTPLPFSALAWKVSNIEELAGSLAAKGVVFERFSFLQQDEHGIWAAPDGAKVAWFKDPDGNLLSLAALHGG